VTIAAAKRPARTSEPSNLGASETGEPAKRPAIRDLAERLHFDPSDGRIWLDDRRMILMHSEAFGILRQEMIDAMGVDAVRGVLTRTGYIAGLRDAAIALKVRRGCATEDLLAAGAQVYAPQGIVSGERVRGEVDSGKGGF
jgi:two-component system, NtrC family, response regulator HydG